MVSEQEVVQETSLLPKQCKPREIRCQEVSLDHKARFRRRKVEPTLRRSVTIHVQMCFTSGYLRFSPERGENPTCSSVPGSYFVPRVIAFQHFQLVAVGYGIEDSRTLGVGRSGSRFFLLLRIGE